MNVPSSIVQNINCIHTRLHYQMHYAHTRSIEGNPNWIEKYTMFPFNTVAANVLSPITYRTCIFGCLERYVPITIEDTYIVFAMYAHFVYFVVAIDSKKSQILFWTLIEVIENFCLIVRVLLFFFSLVKDSNQWYETLCICCSLFFCSTKFPKVTRAYHT